MGEAPEEADAPFSEPNGLLSRLRRLKTSFLEPQQPTETTCFRIEPRSQEFSPTGC
jgi:hypothetical protein